jgi:Family of unknown function (DUF6518)
VRRTATPRLAVDNGHYPAVTRQPVTAHWLRLGSAVRISPWVRLVAAAAIGILIGTLTSFGQAHLELPWLALVNSASPWLLGSFAAGALQPSRNLGVLAGLGACVLEVVAYYMVTAARGYGVSQSEIIFWVVCALVGGPLFGWSGWAWRSGPERVRPWGGALLAATWLAEGIGSYLLRLGYHSAAVLFLLIGFALLVVVVLVSQSLRRRLAATAGITVLAGLVGVVIYWQGLDALTGSSLSW